MTNPSPAIGIDIGGSSAKGGLVTFDGRVLAHSSVTVADDDSREKVLADYEELISNLLTQAGLLNLTVSGIGVGVPGYLDASRGVMTYGNVRCLEGFPLSDHLRQKFDVPVRLDNDANCAALAEYYWGSGVGCDRLIVATVGSGIGVAVMIDGKLLRYTFATAGELGSLVVDACGGKAAFLGGQGGLESVASSRAMIDVAATLNPRPNNVAELAELARSQEAAAAIIRQAGWWLGIGIASWAAIFAPKRVLIGGGVAACGELFLDAARQSAVEAMPPFYKPGLTITAADLVNQAGFMGAASLILLNPV